MSLYNTQMNDANWKTLYEKEIQENYGNWENYITEKLKLKKNFINMILKNANGHGKQLSSKPIVESGSGTAIVAAYLASLGYISYAVDCDNKMLEVAKWVSKELSPENPVKMINANIVKLPFEDKAFAVSHSSGVLEHFQDEQIIKILNEQLRVADSVVFAIPTMYFQDDTKMYGDERRLPKNYWRELISESDGEIVGETDFHYWPLKKRLVEIAHNPKKLIYPKANFAFAIKDKNDRQK